MSITISMKPKKLQIDIFIKVYGSDDFYNSVEYFLVVNCRAKSYIFK